MLLGRDELLKVAKKGDIFVMTSFRFDPIASLVRWVTGSKYSHTAMYCGNGKIVESIYTGVHCVDWCDVPYGKDYNITILRPQLSDECITKAVTYALEKDGDKYDFLLFLAAAPLVLLTRMGWKLRSVRNVLDLKKAYVCSELVVDSFFEGAGVRVVDKKINRSQTTPDDLVTNGQNLKWIADYNNAE